jgi:hypothetical protein
MSCLRPEKKPDGTWLYPCLVDVLKKAGLETIAHYMDIHQQTVANFIVNQPIWELCAGAVWKRGSPVQLFWWDQPMDLELARERGNMPPPSRLRSLQPLRTRTRIGVGLRSPIPIESQFLELGMQTCVGPLPERWVVVV